MWDPARRDEAGKRGMDGAARWNSRKHLPIALGMVSSEVSAEDSRRRATSCRH